MLVSHNELVILLLCMQTSGEITRYTNITAVQQQENVEKLSTPGHLADICDTDSLQLAAITHRQQFTSRDLTCERLATMSWYKTPAVVINGQRCRQLPGVTVQICEKNASIT